MQTTTHLLFGATGLIGNHILPLIPDDQYLITITRKPLPLNRKNYLNIVSDLSAVSINKLTFNNPIDYIYCCLGTTIKVAGSSEKFYQVDHDLVVDIAKLSNRLKVKKLLLVSAVGANPQSKVFYSKTKGEMERDTIAATPDVSQVIFIRPSLLLGDRDVLHQPSRFGQKIATRLAPFYSKIFFGPFKKYSPVEAKEVAKKMVSIAISSTNKNRLQIIWSKV